MLKHISITVVFLRYLEPCLGFIVNLYVQFSSAFFLLILTNTHHSKGSIAEKVMSCLTIPKDIKEALGLKLLFFTVEE